MYQVRRLLLFSASVGSIRKHEVVSLAFTPLRVQYIWYLLWPRHPPRVSIRKVYPGTVVYVRTGLTAWWPVTRQIPRISRKMIPFLSSSKIIDLTHERMLSYRSTVSSSAVCYSCTSYIGKYTGSYCPCSFMTGTENRPIHSSAARIPSRSAESLSCFPQPATELTAVSVVGSPP